ncbi:salicylate hydroxylase [Pyrenophora seminiperda CCB06]|uniref:Salicylate hydroxylase n=1 Tax=Pyrenophora seminiperda CCB06 TaxID=1302712 RepID=A0A3M7M4I1_9PLEO|nr:salicylate hydroxylase [Pyrenophora seminiperda CCB06]
MAGDTSNDFHVAIVGAGVGGLALAMGLHKKSVSFTLYEEEKEYSAYGAGIGFAPNGLRAMDLIEPGFQSGYEKICVGNKPADAQDIFFEGFLLEEGLGLDQPWAGKSSWGHPNFDRKSVSLTELGFAHRKDLLDIMTTFIPIQNVKFSKCLTNIEQHPDKVVLKFANGDTAEASVLVGADGIKSIVREHVLKPMYPDQVSPVYADSYCYRGVIPISSAEEILGTLTDVARIYFGHDRAVVTYRISGGKVRSLPFNLLQQSIPLFPTHTDPLRKKIQEFNFLHCVGTTTATSAWPTDKPLTQKVPHSTMISDFSSPNIDPRFCKLLSLAKPIQWGLFHHPHTSTYYRDRVVLMGDSAHASLPFQAAGAAQGVEDALVLSNLLAELMVTTPRSSEAQHIHAALEAYDEVRRPRAQRQLEQSEEVMRIIFLRHEKLGSDMGGILRDLQRKERWEWLWFHDVGGDVEIAKARMKRNLI